LASSSWEEEHNIHVDGWKLASSEVIIGGPFFSALT
jgi:hypothetical protein